MAKFTLSLDGPLIQLPNNLAKESFDYVGRYQIVGEILTRYFSNKKSGNILDVGGRGGFLHKITPLTVTILDEEGGADENVQHGDGTSLSIADNTYDAVVTCDTLEHIAKKDRKKFVQELIRVSNDLVILCAPFSDFGAAKEEKNLQTNFTSLTGAPHRWLKEHAEYTLPKLSETLAIFKSSGFSVVSFGHSSLQLWRQIMQANLLSHETGSIEVHKQLQKINTFYNSILFEDFSDKSYRSFIVLSKKQTLNLKKTGSKLLPEHYEQLIELLAHFNNTVLQEAEQLPLIKKQLNQLQHDNHQLKNTEALYHQLLQSPTWRYTAPIRQAVGILRNIRHNRNKAL